MQTIKFRLAEIKDVLDLHLLINRAYRFEVSRSWTNENQVVAGDRISLIDLEKIIQNQQVSRDKSQFLVVELNDQLEKGIIGCITLNYDNHDVEIGTFCISPDLQNYGYGKQVLNAAELYATKFHPNLKTFSMWVLSTRQELIAFYERRGYIRTDQTAEYPIQDNVGQPMVDLHLIQLVKSIGSC
ncbi:GNAT family N-acetyltransferase [Acinetobacter shaoyimingii]|uniref:GNAT family N-acetyltransferase n=1 Tax=Acinetobacter shaoyimingii TaxID=2715164 RepID=A0A6G8RVH0_9GAMM|nr:GNAT family N-acetyltransferase [Acinetobacter shaoyimingii]NHB59519.1 GNAT family N-acetyltransferase [Acinetobacter shaoyimingii]QIO05788.1 GNAT family N-acetyltransferase [Acinetobacter shaoyimingii]